MNKFILVLGALFIGGCYVGANVLKDSAPQYQYQAINANAR